MLCCRCAYPIRKLRQVADILLAYWDKQVAYSLSANLMYDKDAACEKPKLVC